MIRGITDICGLAFAFCCESLQDTGNLSTTHSRAPDLTLPSPEQAEPPGPDHTTPSGHRKTRFGFCSTQSPAGQALLTFAQR